MWLAGAVVACWSLSQKVAGSSPFTIMNIFIPTLAEFSLGKNSSANVHKHQEKT